MIIGEDELLLPRGKDIDDIEELFDSRLLLASEDSLVEEVKTVACGPLKCKDFSVLVKGYHVFPCLLIVFQLLQEATDADYYVLAFTIRTAHSIQLQHVAPFNARLNLQCLEQLRTKQPLHHLDVVLVFCSACRK